MDTLDTALESYVTAHCCFPAASMICRIKALCGFTVQTARTFTYQVRDMTVLMVILCICMKNRP